MKTILYNNYDLKNTPRNYQDQPQTPKVKTNSFRDSNPDIFLLYINAVTSKPKHYDHYKKYTYTE